jgi:hypothetical protein
MESIETDVDPKPNVAGKDLDLPAINSLRIDRASSEPPPLLSANSVSANSLKTDQRLSAASMDGLQPGEITPISPQEQKQKPIAVVPSSSKVTAIIQAKALEVEEVPWEENTLTLRDRVTDFVAVNSIIFTMDVLQAIISVLSIIMYVTQTYYANEDELYYDKADSVRYAEFTFGMFFTLDYLLRFYIAPNRIAYFFTMEAFGDLLTIVPVFTPFMSENGTFTFNINADTSTTSYFGFLRITRCLKILRITRLGRVFRITEDSYKFQVATVAFKMFSLFFCAAGGLQVVEEGTQHLPFHDAFYMTVTTGKEMLLDLVYSLPHQYVAL